MILVNSFDKFYSVVNTKLGVVCCSYLEESLATRVLAIKGELIMIWDKSDFKELLSLPVQRLTSFEDGFVFTEDDRGAIYYFDGNLTSKLIPADAALDSISPKYSDD